MLLTTTSSLTLAPPSPGQQAPPSQQAQPSQAPHSQAPPSQQAPPTSVQDQQPMEVNGGTPSEELTDELTQFLLASMSRTGTTIVHTRNPSAPGAPAIVISPDFSSSAPDVFSDSRQQQSESHALSAAAAASSATSLLDGLRLSPTTLVSSPSYNDNTSTMCSKNAQSQTQVISFTRPVSVANV